MNWWLRSRILESRKLLDRTLESTHEILLEEQEDDDDRHDLNHSARTDRSGVCAEGSGQIQQARRERVEVAVPQDDHRPEERIPEGHELQNAEGRNRRHG